MKKFKGIGFYVGLIAIVLLLIAIFTPSSQAKEMTYSRFVAELNNQKISTIKYDGIVAEIETKEPIDGETKWLVQIPSMDAFMALYNGSLSEGKISDEITKLNYEPSSDKTEWFSIIFSFISIAIMGIILFSLFSSNRGGAGKAMGFAKSPAKLKSDSGEKVDFSKVAGAEEEKEELKEIVQFLKKPEAFLKLGARIPRGVLLVGPPGTGKTLLARAVAGEADVPFFTISGSDFVEMFVGVGASRVRDLFEQAKKQSPCIIFIDEIDAVGRRRGAGLGNQHDEREQTLNQLLVEMDGFSVNQGVIVMAATNRADVLDPALLRPGRFDRRIVVGLPDVKGREAILRVHAANKQLGEDIDLADIAKLTPGFTGADLENLLNEAALLAARKGKTEINSTDIKEATYKVQLGPEKKSRVMSDKDKDITAYHEGGHALAIKFLSSTDTVDRVSVIPAGAAGGYTAHKPIEDVDYVTKAQLIEDIMVALGGKAAEEIVYGDVTTGAYSDLKHANAIAKAMVTQYGMSETLGCLVFGGDNDEIFIGRDFAHTREYSDSTAAEIDAEIRKLIEQAFEKAKEMIREKRDLLEIVKDALVEREKLSGEEFDILCNGGELPEMKLEEKVVAEIKPANSEDSNEAETNDGNGADTDETNDTKADDAIDGIDADEANEAIEADEANDVNDAE